MLNRPINSWWNVLAGTIGNAFNAGIVLIYVISFYTNAISTDNQFDREILSFSFTCFFFATGIGTITLGRLIHGFGIRTPAIVFLLIYGCTLAVIPLLPLRHYFSIQLSLSWDLVAPPPRPFLIL